MRRFILSVVFFGLLAATCCLWALRFERTPGLAIRNLSNLPKEGPKLNGLQWLVADREPLLRVSRAAGDPPVAVRIPIADFPAVEGLHVRYRIKASALGPGKEDWEDGRFIIEWHDPQTSTWENDPAGSIRFSLSSNETGMVMRPMKSPAVPALRFEHLGRSGSFEITDLEIAAVHERSLWLIGRWFLAAGWLAWCGICIQSWTGIGWLRASMAASLWLILIFQFAVPGPWKTLRPLCSEFHLGDSKAGATEVEATLPSGLPTQSGLLAGEVKATGKIAVQGSIPLRIKYWIVRARPLLHILMLAAPAAAFALLVGKHASLFPSITLALGIELAQIGFGYGFGWDDVLDLLYDATGIALGLWATGWMMKKMGRQGSALSPKNGEGL